MPTGTYAHLDPYDGAISALERFSCAPGPAGWRYVSELLAPDGRTPRGSIDLTVDSRWRQIRLEMRAGGWTLRGGVTGRDVLWVRSGQGGQQATEHSARASGFTGRSPGFLVALVRLADLDPGERVRLAVVELTEPALVPMPVERGLAFAGTTAHETETEPLRVERYEVADLATGEQRSVHLAGDVVLDAPGLELHDLENAPNQ